MLGFRQAGLGTAMASGSASDVSSLRRSMCRYFLRSDPLWKERLALIWDWPTSPVFDASLPEADLVAKDANDGSYWAIVCRLGLQEGALNRTHLRAIDALAKHAGTLAHLLVITDAPCTTGAARKALSATGAVLVDLHAIESSGVDWTGFADGTGSAGKRRVLEPRDYQRRAIEDVARGFEEHARGKLIMACGTGKTLTSLRIAERICPAGSLVLFLAPSIQLVAQSLRVWASQAKEPLQVECVCSDASASRTEEDVWDSSLADVPYPATTDPAVLARRLEGARSQHTTVVFCTYQSVQVVADALRLCDGLSIDLAICDEAHRTTGVMAQGMVEDSASEFLKIHDDSVIHASRRLYMTATERIFGSRAKRQAGIEDFELASMDDERTFGPVFHRLSFATAIEMSLLCDYKPLALAISEDALGKGEQRRLSDQEGVGINEAVRIIGCWKGLAGQTGEAGRPLTSAVAFCSTIAESRAMAGAFEGVVGTYLARSGQDGRAMGCKADHIDGSMPNAVRQEKLRWLAEQELDEHGNPVCHILFNARCLAEGIDVPSLDAVMFLHPKRSQIDVVQAIGRVIRRSEGKRFGYIIMPIAIPAGRSAEEVLDSSEDFAIVWQVLKALRAHDERMGAQINSIAYEPAASPVVEVQVVGMLGQDLPCDPGGIDEQTLLLQKAVYARIVRKCGTRVYWEEWAKDIAVAYRAILGKVRQALSANEAANEAFRFLIGQMRSCLGREVGFEQASEMLAEHIVTRPVFTALFGSASPISHDPVARALEQVSDAIGECAPDDGQSARQLESLYASVRVRASQMRTDAGKQALIKELYESFFRHAFPKTSSMMGIVYSPAECVDFLIFETERILRSSFGIGFGDEGVHVLDPFTGTGTFIERLITSGLIGKDDLERKYAHELHCNEVVLLAYYIACANISSAYSQQTGADAQGFPGAVLADTFEIGRIGDERAGLSDNAMRARVQNASPMTVIISNPPWVVGQDSANMGAPLKPYPDLDARIYETYVRRSDAKLAGSLHDQYIRAYRWASDRVGDATGRGVVAFLSNAGWLRGSAASGFRRSLCEEFSEIYVLDLLGNQRTVGEESRRQGGKVFGSGSRAPVCMTFLVKDPSSPPPARIRYKCVEPYMTREEKLDFVARCAKDGVGDWERIEPDGHGDWLEKRNPAFDGLVALAGPAKMRQPYGVFKLWTHGVKTQRDAWAWSFSKERLYENISSLAGAYNACLARYAAPPHARSHREYMDLDPSKISWSHALEERFRKRQGISVSPSKVRSALYRPFCKKYVYFDEALNERLGLCRSVFPSEDLFNLAIVTTGGVYPCCLMVDRLFDLHLIRDTQAFPLYHYTPSPDGDGYDRHDAISDEALKTFQEAYPDAFADAEASHGPSTDPRRLLDSDEPHRGAQIQKEDIFFYVYGILHSPLYRQRFLQNLRKQLPKIPLARDFRAFYEAGRRLARLHVRYEDMPASDIWEESEGGLSLFDMDPGRVSRMRYGKAKGPSRGEYDKGIIVYNEKTVLSNVPVDAQRYLLAGRSALDWVLQSYADKTDKDSRIQDDPNGYSEDPRYIIDLIGKVAYVSVQTKLIEEGLPEY